MGKLTELAERCEKAAGPDPELAAEIAVAIDFRGDECNPAAVRDLHHDYGGNNSFADIAKYWPRLPCYTASLDAAMTLVPEGATTGVFTNFGEGGCKAFVGIEVCRAATPALALCAAALRARTQNTPDSQRGEA